MITKIILGDAEPLGGQTYHMINHKIHRHGDDEQKNKHIKWAIYNRYIAVVHTDKIRQDVLLCSIQKDRTRYIWDMSQNKNRLIPH